VSDYRYTRNSGSLDEETKKLYMLIGICVVAVIIVLVLSLTIQKSCSEPEIPVIEQGDGIEEPGWEPQQPVVSGDLIIDEGNTPVTEFTVTVTGADGKYTRTDEGTSAAELVISGQNSQSFSFVLTVGGASVEGDAYFSGEQSAVCEKAEGILSFGFEGKNIFVTCDGVVAELGENSAEGMYVLTEAAQTTTTESTESTEATTTTTTAQQVQPIYDLDAIKSEKVQNALSGMMDSADYKLTRDLLDAQGGYGIIYGTGDSALEVQGRSFNLDTQMNAVMYYSFEGGTGREVVVLCTTDGKVYAGVCDGSEYRYYTNDSARGAAGDAPSVIAQYAKIKGMTLGG